MKNISLVSSNLYLYPPQYRTPLDQRAFGNSLDFSPRRCWQTLHGEHTLIPVYQLANGCESMHDGSADIPSGEQYLHRASGVENVLRMGRVDEPRQSCRKSGQLLGGRLSLAQSHVFGPCCMTYAMCLNLPEVLHRLTLLVRHDLYRPCQQRALLASFQISAHGR